MRYQKQTYRIKDQISDYQREGVKVREKWVKAVKKYKLPVVRLI